MSKHCPKCNISSDAKFCAECGSKTVDKPSGNQCSCGQVNGPQFKFCANCGQKVGASVPSSPVSYSEPSFRPSAGAVQTSGVQEFQGRLSEVQSDDERAEALKKEEERMNKKLGTFSAPSGGGASGRFGPNGGPLSPRGMKYGGLQGAYMAEPLQMYAQPEPVVEPVVKSAPLYAPVKQQATSQARAAVQVTADVVEEVVVPVNKGPETVCSIDIAADATSASDNPSVESRQQHSHIQFYPIAGRTHFRFECTIEGSSALLFKLRTTTGGILVKRFTLPYQFASSNVRLVGNTVELEII